jgi:hypothetical protein
MTASTSNRSVSAQICLIERFPAFPLRKAASDFLIAHAAGDTDEHTPPRLKLSVH